MDKIRDIVGRDADSSHIDKAKQNSTSKIVRVAEANVPGFLPRKQAESRFCFW
jgi:hypothetical protein